MTDAALEQRIRDGLGRVEDLLREAASSDHPFIGQTANHLVDAGGKRFRPLLTLLAAEFGDFAAPGVVPAAAVVELTHLATLYHDDVMDEAPLRRGVPTANARWDNSIAILTGDFLFARASQILADLGPEAVRLQAETFERLVAGQINECIGPKDGQAPIDHYLSVLVDKTGSLIATSARFGALLSGAPGPVVDTLTRFGEVFGVAFQLSDDVLDIASDSDQSGKTPGTDLREGVPTLPTLYALASTDRESARLRELLSAPITDDALVREVLADLRVHPSIDQARQTVARYADEACELLESLPDNAAKETLLALCEIVGSRTV
ncbi:polyprenyl synthetase family protein [Actinocrinis puniceicyclus]|uniref:Polyprenyl synthetase family protein n=1 Tax=Actinocrinis puniceicyclus TaxID=977794 RepID=A0A8J8BAN1_9ACTN|nr:polyprenyl synthetase family protein [Actinocrinis puniceicyclus]